MNNFNPEALLIYPNIATVQILSDDGDMKLTYTKKNKKKKCRCKDLEDTKLKYFRSIWIDVD